MTADTSRELPGPLVAAAVFVASMSVLVLEIVAGRILAPFVGVSLETFTGIIGTVLAAIALGAWAGGKAADAVDPARLVGPVLIAGGFLAVASPMLVTVVGQSVRGDDPGTIVGLAFIGFFAPAAVLSTVTPLAAKTLLATLDDTGSVVGSLSATATAGALVGTFVTGFVLIASIPSKPITWVVGAVLLALGLVLLPRLAARIAVSSVLGFAVLVSASTVLASPCDHETPYSCAVIEVDSQRESGRVLILDTFVNSVVDLDDPTYLSSRYALVTDAVIDIVAPAGAIDVAYIGGGGYTLPRRYWATRGARATVLELDPALRDIAVDELGLEPGPWLRTLVGDARISVTTLDDGAFDVIVGDAFSGRSVPWHLTTKEFLSEVRSKLSVTGVYVMNVIDHPPLAFVEAEAATLLDAFPHVAVVAPTAYLAGERGGNFILVGSNIPIDGSSIADSTPYGEVVIVDGDVAIWTGDVRVLTDDFAPTDQLLSRPS